ncbi:MAG: N-acetylglucosaminidase, partial [Sarcina sp.]
ASITPPTTTGITKGNNTYNNIPYNSTLNNYVANELNEYMRSANETSLSKSQLSSLTNQLTNAINPKAAKTVYEFLRVDQYRNVNENAVASLLSNKGIFAGHASAFINAAQTYNLDPVYLIAQSMLETGNGLSSFAQGTTINEIANFNKPIHNKEGQLTGYQMIKLAHPVTVYNFFGIDAQANTPTFANKTTVCATTYAYNHGWTSVNAAIMGAAKFLSANYIHNGYLAQNTPYELRYIDGSGQDMWHQYSSDINYGAKIATLIEQYKGLYSSNDQFTFTTPQFQNSSNNTNNTNN